MTCISVGERYLKRFQTTSLREIELRPGEQAMDTTFDWVSRKKG
jgi:hypothetical protein